MSLRLEMLGVAARAPSLLGRACERVGAFVRGQFGEDGGARNRAGLSDLYYTVFALDALAALGEGPPGERVRAFVERFGDGAGLDLVHLACLVHCRSALELPVRAELLARLEGWRSADGGYGAAPGQALGSVYPAFMALGAYGDLGRRPPEPERLAASLEACYLEEGAYAGTSAGGAATTPVTIAAATALRHLGREVPAALGEWLLARRHRRGGFLAHAEAPLPDLLSTATALVALADLGFDLVPLAEPCLDFIDSLWDGHSFHAHWADEGRDCEYAWYGLLALGRLEGGP